MSSAYEGLQELAAEVPALVQPLVVAVAGMVPYVEGEGAAALGVFAGVHPAVAALAAAAGNVACVVVVVLLSSRAREAVVATRSRRATVAGSNVLTATGGRAPGGTGSRASKGRRRLERWLARFGVPVTSLLAPLALPTMLTAATFVASGVPKQRVLVWQVVAIVVWTAAFTAIATGIVSAAVD